MENANVQLTLESKINGDEISDVKEYITTDYNKFSYVKINRDINRKYVAKLKNSMKEKGYVGPGILVNENLEILDGQHRFISCQELGIPVKYIVKTGYSIEEIAALNMNGHNWNVNTFMWGLYCKRKCISNLTILECKSQKPISLLVEIINF